MKKNLLIALFATATMAGAAQAADPIIWDGTSKTVDVNSNVFCDDWSIKLTLNAQALNTTFGTEPQKNDLGRYEASQKSGHRLFTVSGDAYQYLGVGDLRRFYEGVNTSYVMGWGNSWYDGWASNGVAQGLQVGVASGEPASDGEGKYDMGLAIESQEKIFAVYRYDTKIDGTKKTLDSIFAGNSVVAAEMYITHDTDTDWGLINGWYIGNDGWPHLDKSAGKSVTSLSFLVELSDGTVLTFVASIDDASTIAAPDGSLLGGSASYDIDFVKSITNINTDLVDGLEIHQGILSVPMEPSVTPDTPGGDTPGAAVPEPTTATLSLLALAGLCARRRRK